ncbi:sulfatase-like hydrolase/transferase, partial [bacterium]|nr:sulfatase-like hydrolase/transferase [bacterium]
NKPVLCPPNPLWMKHEEVTMAEMLKKAGYTTCHIGKWHLGPDAWYPETQGFDYNIGGCDYGQPPSYFDPYDNKRLDNIPTLKPRDKGEYLTDRLGDEAVRFMKKHKDQPFFLYMANYAVHTPIQAKESYIEKYKNKPKTENHDNAKYAGMVESVDDCVGKIMNTLDELDLADDTLIIFTGDNGGLEPVTDNAPLRAGKGHPYEGGIREPLIVRWPGKVEAGRVSDEPVTSVDFFPTICQAAGVGLPENRAIDGETMMPLLRQGGGMKRDAIYWHFPHYRGSIDPYSIIREGDWKLLKKYGKGTFELYNLKEDISEKNDLAKQKPDKVKALNKKLERWLKETGAKVPIPNPNYEG